MKNIIPSETIEKITQTLSITDLISSYSELKKRGKGFNGTCPICKSTNGFTVSPQKNICKCFSCGIGGSPINILMKIENLNFKAALNFILCKFERTLDLRSGGENPLIKKVLGSVYVLKLENDCFYIGFTYKLKKKINEHFSGTKILWTIHNKPISVLKVFPNETMEYANQLTERAIEKFGYEHVRGGDYIYFLNKYGK